MLSEYEKSLVAAAVDGELSIDDYGAFDGLLARSPMAAELHRALVRDRERLMAIPRRPAPDDLATAIFAAIQRDCPTVPARTISSDRGLKWVPAAMAASFLIAVSSASYWFVAGSQSPRMAHKQLQQLPKDNVVLVPKSGPSRVAVLPETPAVETPKLPAIPMVPPTAVATNQVPEPAIKSEVPESVPDRILTAPVGSEVKAFDRVELKLPILATLADMTREEQQASLKTNLARDPATRIDVFAKDTSRAAEALVASAKAVNLNIQLEAIATERLKRKLPTAWWIYTEALTPDEVAKWLAETATADAAIAAPAEKVFGNIHVLPASVLEQKDSAALLEVDLTKKVPSPTGANIAGKTIEELAGALQKTETPKPGILVTYFPQPGRAHPKLSKDIKQFNDLRKDRKSGTVPLVIVIRPATS